MNPKKLYFIEKIKMIYIHTNTLSNLIQRICKKYF